MSYISYQKYKEITKGFKSVRELKVGCYYYIDDAPQRSSKSHSNYRTVIYGKYINEDKIIDDTYYNFSDIRFIVNPFGNTSTPFGFEKKSHAFVLDKYAPCDHHILNKKKNIEELESTIDELKVQPVEEGESNIYFIGKDYRRAMKRLNKTYKHKKSHTTHESPKSRSHTTPKSHKTHESHKSRSHTTPKTPKSHTSASLGGKRKTQKRKTSKIHK